MSILIPTPADHNHTTEVFKRTLASASFLCNAQDTIAIHKMPKAKSKGRWFYRAAVAMAAGAVLIALTGCEKAERMPAPVSAKVAALSVFYCPGMAAVWLDDKTVTCLKETP